jgi:LemA protein
LLVIGAVLVFWMLGAYNRLVGLRTAIGAAWAKVDEQLQRRQTVLEPVVEALRPLLSHDDPHAADALLGALLQVRAAADSVRARPVSAAQVGALATAEGVFATALARLVGVLERHPEEREGLVIAQGLTALRELEPQLTFARQLFNDSSERYNEAARQLPTRLLTRLFGFGIAGRL